MSDHRIEVFLRSIVLPSHLAEFKDSYDLHYHLEIHHRDTYHWLREQGFTKGRVFEPDSAALLPTLEMALERLPGRVAVHDLSTLKGKARGWLVGVRRAPCVRLGGQTHRGLAVAQQALRRAVEHDTNDAKQTPLC